MPIGVVTVDVGLDWSTAVSEFVGGLWIIRGLAANGDMTYNATTLRYMSLGSPLASSGVSAPAGATFRNPKRFTVTRLGILFEATFPGAASASFRLYVDGTQSGIQLDLVTGDRKKIAHGSVIAPQDAMVCLECTAVSGGPPNIQAIALGMRLAPGSNPDI